MPPKLFFVDDEPNIRMTLLVIPRQNSFEVTAAARVAEAMALITALKYDS